MTVNEIPWMWRGDTPLWEVTVLQYEDGPPFNLDVVDEIWFTAKRSVTDPDAEAVFQLTLTGGEIVITDGPNGLATVTPLATSTSSLTKDTVVVWDFQIRIDSPLRTYTPIRGSLLIRADVTRA